jgi:rhodanese-related sulfurtransferase
MIEASRLAQPHPSPVIRSGIARPCGNIGPFDAASTAMTQSITPQALKSKLHDGSEFALLDVREAGQFGESHLLFATPLPYSRLELDIGALVPCTSAAIVLVDDGDSGVALLAEKRLAALGYADLAVLHGGTRGWSAAGYALFAGVNVPSKTFGELVEHAYHTPRVSVQALKRMQEAGEDLVVLDGRPFAEYRKMNIPGGICCPNAELPLRVKSLVKHPKTKIVVNCAGRTRSIIGAQTLINFGIENPVYALENGTQGWSLADYELERGATRTYPGRVDEGALPALQSSARVLMGRFGVKTVDAATAQAWLDDGSRCTYLIDVRSPEEYAAGSLPGAVHAAGGQLIQATDQWVGVRNARILLADAEGVRAPVVASWLRQLGCDAYVLEDGVRAKVRAKLPATLDLPQLPTMTAARLKDGLDAKTIVTLDLRPSMAFRQSHSPGSRWTIRPRAVAAAQVGKPRELVLVADDAAVAKLAAIDLAEAGVRNVSMLEGGVAAWRASGYPVGASPEAPPDGECIDYLFFVHDRHTGNRAAMRQYLAWETGLLAQLDEQDKSAFRIGATH